MTMSVGRAGECSLPSPHPLRLSARGYASDQQDQQHDPVRSVVGVPAILGRPKMLSCRRRVSASRTTAPDSLTLCHLTPSNSFLWVVVPILIDDFSTCPSTGQLQPCAGELSAVPNRWVAASMREPHIQEREDTDPVRAAGGSWTGGPGLLPLLPY